MATPLSKKSEAIRLHKLGFAIHWLKNNSKVPVKGGWTNVNRDTLKTLLKEYKKEYNVGTKLGEPSRVGFDSYLAVIDVDVKGSEKKHANSAMNWLKENLPGLIDAAPITLSGRGNNSMHIWCLVDSPLESRALSQSSEEVEVMMPSAKPTQRQIEILGKKKIKQGWRLRPAWEIDFMCAGRQVVLPPSIHPDTKKPYRWKRPIEDVLDLPFIDESMFEKLPTAKKLNKGRPQGSVKSEYEIVDPDEMQLDLRLAPHILDGIYEGENVSDRSAMALSIALAMVNAKFSDAEILGVLTNREYYIGDCAFEHAKTNQRQRAARWAHDYCLMKARHEADATYIFQSEIEEYETLSPEEAKKQTKRLVTDKEAVDWRKTLDRDGKENIRPTFFNIQTILTNVVGEKIFHRDDFAFRDFYAMKTPWGKKPGDEVNDADKVLIKDWFTHTWSIEPNTTLIEEFIIKQCETYKFHPVREYLSDLEWDGVSRVDSWLSTYLGAVGPEEYVSIVGRKFLLAAVARIFEPGIKFDYMMILEGGQGIGKSSTGKILAKDWFIDSLPDLSDKEAALNLQGNWLCEMGELANLRKADVETTKAFISRDTDKVRPPYGRRSVELKRQCVFFGTTNANKDYLKDKTGNRRFLPITVTNLDRESLIRDRDQLWAEAVYLYDMLGEPLYIGDDIKSLVEEEQSDRVSYDEHDLYLDMFLDWFEKVKKQRKQEKIKGKLKFRASDFFTGQGFSEFSDSSPFGDLKISNYTLQMIGRVIRDSKKFERKKSNGKVSWVEI